MASKIEVLNVNVPSWRGKVDEEKYVVMKKALLELLPDKEPGLTQSEIRANVREHLPQDVFPNGEKSDWWSKCVQLDLEARGIVIRESAAKPLRWHRRK